MSKNFYFIGLVAALLVGVLIGTKSCRKTDNNVHVSNQDKTKDTVYITQFKQVPPDTVFQYKDKIVYKTVLISGSKDTIIKTVPKIEYQVQIKYQDKFIKDTTCLDSIDTYKDLVKELNDSISKLQEYKVFKGETKNKYYNQTYAILGRDVSNMSQTVTIRNRVELTPMIGLSYQTNGKAFKDFTYKPFVGGTINYNHFSLFGGILWDTYSNDYNSYIIGSGYKLKL